MKSTAGTDFLLFVGVIWWGQHNLDGGGYLAQRLFAAKTERHAVLGYLWFTIAHICLRPWPWIVVGIAGMAMLGPAGAGLAVDDPEKYYPLLMRKLLPAGLFGLMVASFLAAFMSTIDTQLNWGASLLTNDFYKRFINPDGKRRNAGAREPCCDLRAGGFWRRGKFVHRRYSLGLEAGILGDRGSGNGFRSALVLVADETRGANWPR